jgi:hypothetical protein
MTTLGLIPRKRLLNIPPHLRVPHEYCFFLHDECARLLCEYEAGQANVVSITFPSKEEAERFNQLVKENGPLDAMRKGGYGAEAKQLVLNQVTMALTSDFLHHVYEGLWCLEKRKVVVAFNVLRKPQKDNLTYLCWMLADPEDFYVTFARGDPEAIAQHKVGNRRQALFKQALAKTDLHDVLDPADIHAVLFDRRRHNGFEILFQHAVHLITTMHAEIKTSPENFNFIFKSLSDDDLYEAGYWHLPTLLLFAHHVIGAVFQQMHPGDPDGHKAASTRAMLGYRLICDAEAGPLLEVLNTEVACHFKCSHCGHGLKITEHNALRIVLTESFRCTSCKRAVPYPFSWMI